MTGVQEIKEAGISTSEREDNEIDVIGTFNEQNDEEESDLDQEAEPTENTVRFISNSIQLSLLLLAISHSEAD